MATTINAKYGIGDTLWALVNGKAVSFIVKSISVGLSEDEAYNYCFYNSYATALENKNISIREEECFPSREELQNYVFGD